MGKGDRTKKAKVVNEPPKRNSEHNVVSVKENKRKRQNESGSEKLTVEKQPKLNVHQNKSVKRKIDFDEATKGGKQVNNNATMVKVRSKGSANESHKNVKSVASGKVLNDRSRFRSVGVKSTDIEEELSSNRVQWTKEFMDKVKKSNEKHKNKVLQGSKINKVGSIVLQSTGDQEVITTGDGIVTEVVTEGPWDPLISEEELDYDDDLSVEDDEVQMGQDSVEFTDELECSQKTEKQKVTQQQPVPGTSKETEQASLEGLDKQTEEQMYNNPVIQKMMEKFFQEKFQSIQTKVVKMLER